MVFIGIDPGTSGSLAFLSDDEKIIGVCDAPTIKTVGTSSRKTPKGNLRVRTSIDVSALVLLLENYIPDAEMKIYAQAVMENVHPMPGEGAVASFTFGRSVGIVQGVLHALRIPFEMVTPQSWKKAMMPGEAKEKGQSMVVVKRLLPSASEWITLKRHHGRADALLIALYGLRKYQKGDSR